MTQTIVALVPMRHTSERVLGKNFRPLGDRPLFHHILGSLLACPSITETVIDTDSETIREDAASSFPDVRVLERPSHLRHGSIPMNEILLHDVRHVPADLYLQTHSTTPFLRPESIERAIHAFMDGGESHDSLFSVTRLQARLWSASGEPINHDRNVLARTQDLAPIFEENSCLYLFTRRSLEQHGNRIGDRPMMFELSKDEALDIDEEVDFAMAEAFHASRQRS